MERAIVEVDRLDVGERAPKATLTGFSEGGIPGNFGSCFADRCCTSSLTSYSLSNSVNSDLLTKSIVMVLSTT